LFVNRLTPGPVLCSIEEKNFKEEMAHVMAAGSDWEKVAKVCDLTPKVSKGAVRDVDRMRTVLIELKNEKKAAV
jgi:ABC-type polysaccharide/polyol phosphate transport system ATPase subunit